VRARKARRPAADKAARGPSARFSADGLRDGTATTDHLPLQVYAGRSRLGSLRRRDGDFEAFDLAGRSIGVYLDMQTALLWATMPKLLAAFEVIAAWGFTYKTCGFVWVKQTAGGDGLHTGMGYWTRSNSEVCLLATKGKPVRIAEDVHQVVLAPVGAHSAKPEEVRHRIERLVAGPYLELFGRKPVEGWTVWGNEIARATFNDERDAA
jgi:N6-adenosine-specific RNA methylase IME4